MLFLGPKNKELEHFADLLVKGTAALFQERGGMPFSKVDEKVKKSIVEYRGKMRADGMEKFDNNPTYVSSVNFYANAAAMEKKKALGALIVYVEESYVAKLMQLLQYPLIDDEDENAKLDSSGTLCNILAGRFKSEISAEGYIELEMSHFSTYRNSAVPGVDFCFNEFDMYMVEFHINSEKRMVLEMTMGAVPKR